MVIGIIGVIIVGIRNQSLFVKLTKLDGKDVNVERGQHEKPTP